MTDKPNNVKKENLDLELRAKEIPENISNKINHYFEMPNRKYTNPLTSSQEFGWYQNEKLNYKLKKYPRYICDVTRYADEYYALKGKSPYATRDVK